MHHVSRSTSIKRGIASKDIPYTKFHIPHTKTKEKGDDISLTDTLCDCSPTFTLDHHLRSNAAIPSVAPLFAFETGNGTWAPMKCTWFLAQCNTIWACKGLSSVKGHGFWIGGTTHLLLLGVDPWVVMVQGRWSSQSFLGYWRKCEEILPLFIGFALHSHESVLNTMSSFKNKLIAK